MEGFLTLLLFAGFFYLMMRFGCGAHMVHGHEEAKPRGVDPVCGMEVAPGEGYTANYEGHEYHFCSKSCLDKFEANPKRHLKIVTGGEK